MFPDTVTILDNMMADGVCDPCIIVTPAYYRGDEEADKNADYITEHFHIELRKDLIPAVEKHYSTYASDDVSEENLIATREHRAFVGLSLGSLTTYRAAFYNNFDLFAWYGPFSGCCGPFGDHDVEVKRICETLAADEKKGLPLKFMFCCNGDKDIAFAGHTDIMGKVLPICPQIKKGENYDFFVIPGGAHDMKAWQLHLYGVTFRTYDLGEQKEYVACVRCVGEPQRFFLVIYPAEIPTYQFTIDVDKAGGSWIFFALLTLFFIEVLAISFYLKRHIEKPLHHLTEGMDEVSKGESGT